MAKQYRMVQELSHLTYEDRLKEMKLPTLQDKRRSNNIIKDSNGIEILDKQDLVIMHEETRQTRAHSKIKMSWCLKDIKKYSFQHRTVDIWNRLNKEVVT